MSEFASERSPQRMASFMSRKVTFVVLGGVILLFLCVVPSLLMSLVLLVGYFSLGWFWFLQRVAVQIRPSPLGISVAIGAIGMFIWGLRYAITAFAPRSSWTVIRTTRTVLCVLATFLAGICLVGLGHEVSWWGRSKTPWIRFDKGWDVAERTQSRNNLKQIGLGIHNYHNAFAKLPPGGVFEADGTAEHGWMARLLPYVDQAPLFSQIDFRVPWYDPYNRTVYETRIDGYLNPGISHPKQIDGYSPSHYAANGHVLYANSGLAIADIKDGASNTLFAGEVKANIRPWGDVVNWRYTEHGINKSHIGFGSPFKGGAQFLLLDGTVRFINENIDPIVLKALGTPAAGDKVSEY